MVVMLPSGVPFHVSRAKFQRLVEEALFELPEPFADALANMALRIEDMPTSQQLKDAGLDEDELLLGLYVGVPLTERGTWDGPRLPDVVYVFQQDIEEVCDSAEQLKSEVRITVLHELGHYFGMDEEQLDQLGYG
jgi:predicted Zn-dependent protease with MMP-like domain